MTDKGSDNMNCTNGKLKNIIMRCAKRVELFKV